MVHKSTKNTTNLASGVRLLAVIWQTSMLSNTATGWPECYQAFMLCKGVKNGLPYMLNASGVKWRNCVDRYANIRLVRWLPQSSLLVHPKTRLFISHCGLNSVMEAAYYGVPVLALPLSGDQFHNAAKVCLTILLLFPLKSFNNMLWHYRWIS